MKIIEDITYSLDDIIDQIKKEFGFIYTEISDHEGYVILGNTIKLNLVFNEEEKRLDHAKLSFPTKVLDLADSTTAAELYSSGIESSIQIVDLVNRMLGSKGKES